MEPCEARISEPPHYLHDHACTYRGKVIVEFQGKPRYLCKIHAKAFDRNPRGNAFSWGWWRP